jgi:MFS family permease
MLANEERPRSVVVLVGSASVLWGALDVLLVVLALDALAMGSSGVGFLNAAVGAGGIVGALLTALLIGRARLAAPFGLGLLLWGGALAAVGLLPLPLVAMLLLAVAGIGRVVMDVAGRTLLQRVSPDALLSRVFGVVEGIDNASLAVGSILAPALLAIAGTRGAFLAAGIALIGFTALNWRRLLRADAAGVVRPRELAALMSVPFFTSLSGQALERLAAALIPVSARTDTQIITQGHSGDRFYIISSGEVRVDVDGRPMRTLGAGQSFGEIALLHDIPRTASVTAISPVELLALDRHHFVETVTGQPAAAAAAEEVIHVHLERADERSETDAGA